MLRPQRLVAAQLQQRLPAVVFVQPYLNAQRRQGLQLIEQRRQAAAQRFAGVQQAAGAIEEAQHLILLLQVGGLLGHALLQPAVGGRQLVGHGVQRAAERRHFILVAALCEAAAKVAAAHRQRHLHQLSPRMQQPAAQVAGGADQQQQGQRDETGLHQRHHQQAALGLPVDIRDQLIQQLHEVRHLRRGVGRALRAAQARLQGLLPIVAQGVERLRQPFLFHRTLQIGAVFVALQFADQRFMPFIQRHLRQQPVALHTQRAGLVDGVRIALNALRHPGGNPHAGHAQNARQQHQQGDLIHDRKRGQQAFHKHGFTAFGAAEAQGRRRRWR